MRRFEFSGRVQILHPVAHTKSAKTHTVCNKKTGKNREFLQKTGIFAKNHTTCTRINPRFLSTYALPAQKFPAKITGNFL